MGTFVSPEEIKSKALSPMLKMMELADIDDLFIIPAERLIAEACNLNLNTEGHPWRWAGTFDSSPNGPRLLTEYENDYRRAVIHTVNRIAATPNNEQFRNFRGASTAYGRIVPAIAFSLMRRWGQPKRLYRT